MGIISHAINPTELENIVGEESYLKFEDATQTIIKIWHACKINIEEGEEEPK